MRTGAGGGDAGGSAGGNARSPPEHAPATAAAAAARRSQRVGGTGHTVPLKAGRRQTQGGRVAATRLRLHHGNFQGPRLCRRSQALPDAGPPRGSHWPNVSPGSAGPTRRRCDRTAPLLKRHYNLPKRVSGGRRCDSWRCPRWCWHACSEYQALTLACRQAGSKTVAVPAEYGRPRHGPSRRMMGGRGRGRDKSPTQEERSRALRRLRPCGTWSGWTRPGRPATPRVTRHTWTPLRLRVTASARRCAVFVTRGTPAIARPCGRFTSARPSISAALEGPLKA